MAKMLQVPKLILEHTKLFQSLLHCVIQHSRLLTSIRLCCSFTQLLHLFNMPLKFFQLFNCNVSLSKLSCDFLK